MSLQQETDRLTLRPWTASDADDYRELVSERGGKVPTVESIRGRIATQLATTAGTRIALLPVRRRPEGDFIGYCGLIVGRTTVDEPEIAYELLRRVHGCGYATEAAGPLSTRPPRPGDRGSGRRSGPGTRRRSGSCTGSGSHATTSPRTARGPRSPG